MQSKLRGSESEILSAAANGDETAFTQLFETFHQELGAFLLRLTKSKVLSEEIVQETFLKIWLNREALKEVKSFRAYLFTVSRNRALNTLRDETKRTFLRDDPFVSPNVTEEPGGIQREQEDKYGMLEKAVSMLPPQQQKVWKLNKEEGLSYQNIAQRLELSPETVKRHVSLAMASVIRYVKTHKKNLLAMLPQSLLVALT
jgi:RNA polymerase sigma-70 factor (family 1)